jgi:hypothetical protein
MRAPVRRTHDPSVRRSVPALAAVLAIGGVLASAGPAAADGPLAPGETRTVVLPVPYTWADDAVQVAVTVGGLAQAENGCLDPEADAGDDCSSDVGELAGKLTATVAWGRTDAGRCEPGAGAVLLDLFGKATARLTQVAGVDCLLLEMAFRDGESDNVAQSDSLTFGLDLVAQGLPDPVGPGGNDTNGDEQASDDQGGDGQGSGTQGSGTQGSGTQGGDGQTAIAQGDAGQAAGQDAGPARGVVPAASAGQDGTAVAQAPAGPVLDRVGAQISVGDDGVAAVETQAASTSIQALVLAWGSLLLGAIALGWAGFVMVMRRRRRKEAVA